MAKSEGHRKRLRDKFLQSGLDGFLDYEIVELLLTLGTPRKDCKPIAKEAIARCGGLLGVLQASVEELTTIHGIGPANVFGLKLFQAVAQRYALERAQQKPILSSPKMVAEYLKQKLGTKKREHLQMLALDTRNQLIKVVPISLGTIDASLVHPREVFSQALLCSASKIILVHNHPSGNPDPSEQDIQVTRMLREAGKLLKIPVIDHIIVAATGYVSLQQLGMMQDS